MEKRNEIGKNGESEARLFLEQKGYRIRHTNWHYHHYELDIVAQWEEELVVVEVKTRSLDYLLEPEEAVDTPKIRRIVAAADAYVRYFNIDLPVRFDIITLLKDSRGYHIREHIEDAFYPPVH
ncbi:MAG TPA: YraN family protein [Candidatus Parabacteroides intestinavium]|nr:YraN family protein [Candidatus Parabacteroides intestinavium]